MFRRTITFAAVAGILARLIQLVSGKETTIEEHPYQAAVYKDGDFLCGGSVISSDMVVTAASCFQNYNASEIVVRVGSSFYTSGGLLVPVSLIKKHEDYDPSTLIYDVAIVKLAQPVTFSASIQPIASAAYEPISGTLALATRWGANRCLNESTQPGLQEVQVLIIPQKICASSSSAYTKDVTASMTCATLQGNSVGACEGDSGGPLASEGKLIGIASRFSGSISSGVYLFTSVPSVRSWIVETAALM